MPFEPRAQWSSYKDDGQSSKAWGDALKQFSGKRDEKDYYKAFFDALGGGDAMGDIAGTGYLNDVGASSMSDIGGVDGGMDFGSFGGFAAEGGPLTAGKTYVVGEDGPELFTPEDDGDVTPNPATTAGAEPGDFAHLGKSSKAHRTILATDFGMDKDKLESMSLPQLKGTLAAIQMKQAMRMNQSKLDMTQAQMEEMASQGAERRDLDRARRGQMQSANATALALQNFFKDFTSQDASEAGGYVGMGSAGYDGSDKTYNTSPEQRMNFALGRNPRAGVSPQFDNSISSLMKFADGAGEDAPVTHRLPGGYYGFTLKGSKNLDVRPDLTNVQTLDDGTQVVGNRIIPRPKTTVVDPMIAAKRSAETAKINRATRAQIQQELDANNSGVTRLEAKEKRSPEEEQRLKSYRTGQQRLQTELDNFDAGTHPQFATATPAAAAAADEETTAAPATDSKGRVMVVDRSGKVGSIPVSQWAAAKAKGYKLAPQ